MTRLSDWKTACAVLALCTGMTVSSFAQIFKTLVKFDGSDGSNPYLMSMVQGYDGSLYGTTEGGGSNSEGAVFKLTRTGKLKTLYSFCSQSGCLDGDQASAGLILATDGSFYGVTEVGGDFQCPFYGPCGTVFKLTPEGTLTTLLSFDGEDGALPAAKLFQGTDGKLYGVTIAGGLGNGCFNGCGTVFEITPTGALTTLHSFSEVEGQNPVGALIQATDGNFYGTTYAGGQQQDGTVFKITSSGVLTTLQSFDGSNGSGPFAGLIEVLDGNFYGVTVGGGEGFGIAFKMTPDGTMTTVHDFVFAEGHEPYSLIQGSDGNFYGTTGYGGDLNCAAPNGCGTVFQLTPSGTLTTLHTFESTDGAAPTGGLVQATNGTFYGTTSQGGPYNSNGTLFSLNMGLGPFVAFVRAAGKIGQAGGILGQALTGTSAVSLNGIPASFTVVSDTFIRAIVPAGATTGYVTVTTPSGTLKSNVPFHVIK